jgi:hypothetical protein
VPKLVILGCAFVVTVAAVVAVPDVVANVAFATVPVTFAPATLFAELDTVACVALATVPVTFAPVKFVSNAPLPDKPPEKVTLPEMLTPFASA